MDVMGDFKIERYFLINGIENSEILKQALTGKLPKHVRKSVERLLTHAID